MTPLYNNLWAWATWIAIGIIAGLVASYFLPGRRNRTFDIIIGATGAIAGGWASVIAIDDSTNQTFAIAAFVALFIAGAALWLYNTLMSHTK